MEIFVIGSSNNIIGHHHSSNSNSKTKSSQLINSKPPSSSDSHHLQHTKYDKKQPNEEKHQQQQQHHYPASLPHQYPNINELPYIFNVGIGKSGTTTLKTFFDCVGYRNITSHYNCGDRDDRCAYCFMDAIHKNITVDKACKGNTKIHCQIESHKECLFPQMSSLADIDRIHPNAKYIFTYRNVTSWVHSVNHWYNLADTLYKCIQTNQTILNPTIVDEKGITRDEILSRLFTALYEHVQKYFWNRPNDLLIIDVANPYTELQLRSFLNLPYKDREHCIFHKNINILNNDHV